MSQPDEVTPIPSSTKAFFQEYDFSQLDVRLHAGLIIERILAYGDRSEVRWLLKTYGRDQIREWISRTGFQRLSWRRYHLWCMVFGIPLLSKPEQIWPH